MEIDPADATRFLADRDAWPRRPTCYGHANLPVTLRSGADWQTYWTPDAFRWHVGISRRICAVAGPGAATADATPEGLFESYQARYGEFSAHYDLEIWYARFAGSRRRILGTILPDQEACAAEFPPVPATALVTPTAPRRDTPRQMGLFD